MFDIFYNEFLRIMKSINFFSDVLTEPFELLFFGFLLMDIFYLQLDIFLKEKVIKVIIKFKEKFNKNLYWILHSIFFFLIFYSGCFVPSELTNELIALFVFFPSLVFYKNKEKKTVLKSCTLLLLVIIVIRILDIISLPKNIILLFLYYSFKVYVNATFYVRCTLILSILLSYLFQDKSNHL